MVTKVNDFETTSPDGLIAAVRFYAPGTEVTVTYTRNGGSADREGHPRHPVDLRRAFSRTERIRWR